MLENDALLKQLLKRLSDLLIEHSIGVDRLAPRPRGGRLTGEACRQVEEVLSDLGSPSQQISEMVYGNGCFAVARYGDAATVYQYMLEEGPDNPDARFNLALACLRLRQPKKR